jgi:LysR family transcriptional regulator, cell division regulator
MMPSSAEIKYFVEVAKTRNISRAAERLGITQPTLSLAIRKLEGSIGTPLLIRTKAGVELTRSGHKFVVQARSLLDEWDKIKADTLKDETIIQGRYTLGCHPSVAIYSLPVFFEKLMTEYPLLEIGLVHDLSRRITEEVVSFKIDFGLVVNPSPHPDLVIKLLCEDEVTFWTARKPSPLQDPKSPDSVLICDTHLIQTQSLLKEAARKGLNFRRIMTSTNLEVIAALVAQGAGAGILPTRVATRVPALGLQLLTKSAPRFADRVCLIYRADAQKSRPGRLLAQRMESELTRHWGSA